MNADAPGGKSVSRQPAARLPQEAAEGLSFLSPPARQIAEVIRVEALVGRILILEREASQNVEGARLQLLEMRQELSDRLLLALFDASGMAAELECEKGRAEAVASGLDEIQNDIQQRRTVIALLADSFAGLLSGVFLFGGSEVLAGGVDVIGNIFQGSFGYAALGGQQEHQLTQSRNLLREVWEGPQESGIFPESVWRFLNWRQENTGLRSRREAIIQDWKKHLGKPDSEQEGRRKELYFGEGGTYSIPELRHRAEMLDRLKASVRLMSQDLNLLFKETLGHLSGMATIASSRARLIE
ncbi:MAG TPA: hypothetical protein VFG71_13330 [Nitrospiraceae bacterium]|nr:hypothetical protein [Nitrospiraceae bacterium]